MSPKLVKDIKNLVKPMPMPNRIHQNHIAYFLTLLICHGPKIVVNETNSNGKRAISNDDAPTLGLRLATIPMMGAPLPHAHDKVAPISKILENVLHDPNGSSTFIPKKEPKFAMGHDTSPLFSLIPNKDLALHNRNVNLSTLKCPSNSNHIIFN